MLYIDEDYLDGPLCLACLACLPFQFLPRRICLDKMCVSTVVCRIVITSNRLTKASSITAVLNADSVTAGLAFGILGADWVELARLLGTPGVRRVVTMALVSSSSASVDAGDYIMDL
jgi:hypothetical protein